MGREASARDAEVIDLYNRWIRSSNERKEVAVLIAETLDSGKKVDDELMTRYRVAREKESGARKAFKEHR